MLTAQRTRVRLPAPPPHLGRRFLRRLASQGVSDRALASDRWLAVPWSGWDALVVLGLHFTVKLLDGVFHLGQGPLVGPHLQLVSLGLAVGWLLIRSRFEWRQLWGPRPKPSSLGFGLLVGIGWFSVEAVVVLVVRVMTGYADPVYPLWTVVPSLASFPWYFPLGFMLVGPFVEETIYRSIGFRGWAQKLRPAGAALLISAWFAVNHELTVYSFVSIFAASLVYIWVQLRTSSMWPAIVSHATSNLLVFVLGLIEFGIIGLGVSME